MDCQEWMDQEVQMEIKEKMERQGHLALMGDLEKKVLLEFLECLADLD